MESKRMTIMFITMMIVIGNFVVQTEAQAQTNPFRTFTCLMTCLLPPTSNITTPPSQMILANKKIDHNDYFCKLGCASHHCLVLSSLQNPNVDKVVDCVDSCSDKCSNKS
ncbi:thionin-like protein 2 isoform X2 [Brassica napus]|uniref:thionin-like protein 2 isoform X2 n=1 Tax=Brassica napus TaxID=3708 RepID=UPI0020788925|nr:thionin-like protein 2 isoform X2 [Brassica napus]